MKILITGGTGYLAWQLVNELGNNRITVLSAHPESAAAVYTEKINPVDVLPQIVTPSALDIAEAKNKPAIYIEEERVTDKIGFRESALFVGLHLKKSPIIAFSEAGEKMKIWDFESKAYIFTTDEKDGWTVRTKDHKLSAQWEKTILITETGTEVLSS